MFAVGVGNAVEEELREIASEPVADHYFYTADFKTINQIGKKLQKKICVGERAQGLSKGRGFVGNRATLGLSVAWVKQNGTVVAAPALGWLTQYQPRHAGLPPPPPPSLTSAILSGLHVLSFVPSWSCFVARKAKAGGVGPLLIVEAWSERCCLPGSTDVLAHALILVVKVWASR